MRLASKRHEKAGSSGFAPRYTGTLHLLGSSGKSRRLVRAASHYTKVSVYVPV